MNRYYYLGVAVGALIRTAIILGILFIIVKAIQKPISKRVASIIGICLAIVSIVIPIIMSATGMPIHLIFGVITGVGAYAIAFLLNRKNDNGDNDSTDDA